MVREKNGRIAGKSINAAVRNMSAKGVEVAEIAKRLGVRYQRVRNVLQSAK